MTIVTKVTIMEVRYEICRKREDGEMKRAKRKGTWKEIIRIRAL